MKLGRKLAAFATLTMLLVPYVTPSVVYADSDKDKCAADQRGDECREGRKAAFQTKFFSQ